METIVIEHRFRGPPKSGNGGYVCGLLAAHMDGVVEVTLRQPPPLVKNLSIKRLDDSIIHLMDGEQLIAEARIGSLTLNSPPPPSFADAQIASKSYYGLKHHDFPTCFVCGPQRDADDGLNIFAGPVAGRDFVAAPWVPHSGLADQAGCVLPEFLWASLDCPGAFASMRSSGKILVLGRMTAEVDPKIKVGERCVVIGWEISAEGRKSTTGTALYSESGDLRAKAQSIWFQVESF